MKKQILFSVVFFALVVGQFLSCTKDQNKVTPTTVYLDLPATPYDYSGDKNLATLGRVLFYDTHLSVNNAISCGSCHKQTLAFSDNVALSRGFENKLTLRNSIPIQNVATLSKLFWDGREDFLPSMVLKPIVHHVEMGMSDIDAIVKKVQSLPYYKDLFYKAYFNYGIDAKKIADALSTFTSEIRASNSRFDKFNQNKILLTALELHGMNLFKTKYNCNVCHRPELPQPQGYYGGGGNGLVRFVNIGLDQNYTDNGLGALNNKASDNGKFKIPSLRNVALTAPYMHDGRFATLDEVLDHYSNGIQNHPNLDTKLEDANHQPLQMNISSQERTAIIAFLNAMTDYTMITDPKLSNPFKIK